jgi:hypothetical protein
MALTDIFESGVTDISWTADGTMLLATSSDGTMISIHFPYEQLGYRTERSIVEQRFRELYNMVPLRVPQFKKEVKVF